MRLIFSILLLSLLALFACAEKAESIKLEKGTPEYDLALELAKKIPILDPEKNEIIATLKNYNISSGEIIQTMAKNFGSRVEQIKSLDAGRLKNIVSDLAKNMAERHLLLDGAKDANVFVSEMQVDSVLNVQFAQSGGKESFMKMLSENKLSIEAVRRDINDGYTIQKYLEKIIGAMTEVSDEEIRSEYNLDKTASVRHVLLLTQGKTPEEKNEILKKMEEILKKAKAGQDFADLAKRYSEDPGSKENGGLYRDFPKGQMVKSFEDAAFNVPVGQISEIVETTYGYHILKIVERKHETRPLEEVKGEIGAQLKKRKQSEAYQNHLDKLKKDGALELKEI